MQSSDVKHLSNAKCAIIETLECRRLFAQTFSLFPDAQEFIGPVYIPPPPAPRAAAAAAVTRKSVSIRSDDIAVINLTFSGKRPEFEHGLWMGNIQWQISGSKTLDDSQARVEQLARHVRDGSREPWTNQQVEKNALTVLDYEGLHFESKTPEYLAQRIKWFKAIAPDAPVTTYGPWIGFGQFNLDVLSNPTAAQMSKIEADTVTYRPLVNELDAINVSVYMLGPGTVERDLAAYKTVASVLRTIYPDKPILAHAWGAYHTSWNKGNSLLSDSATRKYVDMFRSHFDGVGIWGSVQENQKLLTLLGQAGNRTRLQDTSGQPTPQVTPPPTPPPVQVGPPIGEPMPIDGTGRDPLEREI